MKSIRIPLLLASAGVVLASLGCSSGPSDTSDGFKPPPVTSKADIQKQIDTVNADPTLQPGQKQMVLTNLKKKLDSAK